MPVPEKPDPGTVAPEPFTVLKRSLPEKASRGDDKPAARGSFRDARHHCHRRRVFVAFVDIARLR
jgi:hypothetical protein